MILPSNPCGKNPTNSQINQETADENKYSKARTIKILLDNSASVSIVHKDVLYKHHRVFKDKKNKWSTMAETLNTTFVTEIILELSELNPSAEIYAKCYLNNKLLNYNLIQGRDILYQLGIIFNLKMKISLGA